MAPSTAYLSGQHSMTSMMDGTSGTTGSAAHGGVLPSMAPVAMHLHMTQHHHHHWVSPGSSVASSGSIGQTMEGGRQLQQQQDDDSGGEFYFNALIVF